MLVVLFRAIILYILIIISIRLMGKRQLGELQPSELVITILISNIASLPIEDTNIPMVLGAIPIFILVSFEIIVSNISLQSIRFRKFVSGRPIVVINNGLIDQAALRKLRFSIDDLMETLRQNQIFDVREVHYAIVETTGKVSILQKFANQPITPDMVKLKGEDVNPPVVIISDGTLLLEAMAVYNISQKWVDDTMKYNNQTVSKIFLMTVDNKLNYYIVAKENK